MSLSCEFGTGHIENTNIDVLPPKITPSNATANATTNATAMISRRNEYVMLSSILSNFEQNIDNDSYKRGIYVFGRPGCGKTTFVSDVLTRLGYDIIYYDTCDTKNKLNIEHITKSNMSTTSVINMFNKTHKKIAIVIDDIDTHSYGDKTTISTLIKILRPKKTKKQKIWESSNIPIICIGSQYVDKKINDLIKVCCVVEIKSPRLHEIRHLAETRMPDLSEEVIDKLVGFSKCNLRIFENILSLYSSDPNILKCSDIDILFQNNIYNETSKNITRRIMTSRYNIEDHSTCINETDRTTIGLLWHENIIDLIQSKSAHSSVPFYITQLDNICFADYIDRITFQKQIWQFNELSSLIKTFKNNKHYNDTYADVESGSPTVDIIRFTKVLTKYSTEYNNQQFIKSLCQKLSMDRKDLMSMFAHFEHIETHLIDEIEHELCDVYEITKLDINRAVKYINHV